ncbi:MAG: DUF1589 domain-containing protein [Rhodopirellula sp. JB055]|uniref:DUF1589 domain-containing protein n=1 Tax=Rhodopirellula sp. JB055 TaxID=3342846 RepID=UPI00370AB855
MLWNKARRPTTLARPSDVRPITPPGTTWPTTPPSQPAALARPPQRSRIRQNSDLTTSTHPNS